MRSKYIVIEGIDGSGKSSICLNIREKLEELGHKVLLITEPSEGIIGKLLQEQMKNLELNQISLALLYAADSYDIQDKNIEDVDFIISDRNFLSTVAYQMMEVDKLWLLKLHKYLKYPDIVFYLDVSVDEALSRIRKRDKKNDVFENKDILLRVKQNYDELIKEDIGLHICRVNTEEKSELEVTNEVFDKIQNSL